MFRFKKKIAIKALEKQKAKIVDKTYYKDNNWIAQTADIVKKYIGNDSSLHQLIDDFSFAVRRKGELSGGQISARFDVKEEAAIRYIDSCIEYIRLNGIIKEPKINFLQKLSDKVVWAILTSVLAVGFYFGQLIKTYSIDREKIRLEEQVKNLFSQIEDYQLIIRTNSDNNLQRKEDE